MTSEASDLRVLHCVVKYSSYSQAAKELGMTPSGVSRVVSRLEERLGVRLLQRTTRRLSLTEAGTIYHERISQILLDLADAEAAVQKTSVSPRGKLRVTAPVAFGHYYLVPLLAELASLHPELSIELLLLDRFVDLVEEGVDLALRIGNLQDSGMIARRLCTNNRILVAAPSYLRKRGKPKTPDALKSHSCALYTGFDKPSQWRLCNGTERTTVLVTGGFSSNSPQALASFAEHGGGITLGATVVVERALQSGSLVRVLPEWSFDPTGIYAVYPSAKQVTSKVRAAVDFLASKLSNPPLWEAELQGKVPGF